MLSKNRVKGDDKEKTKKRLQQIKEEKVWKQKRCPTKVWFVLK